MCLDTPLSERTPREHHATTENAADSPMSESESLRPDVHHNATAISIEENKKNGQEKTHKKRRMAIKSAFLGQKIT